MDVQRKMVWVASFQPHEELGSGVGGFNWFPDLFDAVGEYNRLVAENVDQHTVRLVPYVTDLPIYGDEALRQRVTDEIDDNLDYIEVEGAAVMEHIPDALIALRERETV